MICARTFRPGGGWPADAFAFGSQGDAAARTVDAMETLWVAPWRAWWALTLESLDARNYRL